MIAGVCACAAAPRVFHSFFGISRSPAHDGLLLASSASSPGAPRDETRAQMDGDMNYLGPFRIRDETHMSEHEDGSAADSGVTAELRGTYGHGLGQFRFFSSS